MGLTLVVVLGFPEDEPESGDSSPFTGSLNGTSTVIDSDADWTYALGPGPEHSAVTCSAASGDAVLNSGSAVVISDGSGKLLAETTAEVPAELRGDFYGSRSGLNLDDRCIVEFEARGLPIADQYLVEIEDTGRWTYEFEDLAEDGWSVKERLGAG